MILLVPALLLWQSSISAKGTAPPMTRYQTDHYGNGMTECLFMGYCQVLPHYAKLVLEQDHNPENFSAWLDFLQQRRGEQSLIHWGRARLAAWQENRNLAMDELKKAWSLASGPEERLLIGRTYRELKK